MKKIGCHDNPCACKYGLLWQPTCMEKKWLFWQPKMCIKWAIRNHVHGDYYDNPCVCQCGLLWWP